MAKTKQRSASPFLRIGIYGLLFLSLAFLVSSIREKTDTRSRASDSIRFGEPLAPPSLRLSVPNVRYVEGSRVPVTLSVATGSLPTVEVRVVADYDPRVLTLTSGDIVANGPYNVTNVEKLENGHLEASFFVTEEAGYKPVSTVAETGVAVLNFTVRDASQESTDIILSYDGIDPELSGIFMSSKESGGEIRNILKSAAGTRVLLTR